MRKERRLSTIQKRNDLNGVFAFDEPGAGGACHVYVIRPIGEKTMLPQMEIVTVIHSVT